MQNILFLCSDNRSRSIFAESIMRRAGIGRFRAFSAGAHPAKSVHPLTLDILQSFDYPTDGLAPKDWFQFNGPDSDPRMDFVLTVCDQTPPDRCPTFAGQPTSARWMVADPELHHDGEADLADAFVRTFYDIKGRIELFLALPLDRMHRFQIEEQLAAIASARLKM